MKRHLTRRQGKMLGAGLLIFAELSDKEMTNLLGAFKHPHERLQFLNELNERLRSAGVPEFPVDCAL